MAEAAVAQILGGDVAVGSTVTVKGWVRTRRDSKAGGGLSFLTVSDGSCFDAVQAVAMGKDVGDVSTIEDEGSVEEAREAWAEMIKEVEANRPS